MGKIINFLKLGDPWFCHNSWADEYTVHTTLAEAEKYTVRQIALFATTELDFAKRTKTVTWAENYAERGVVDNIDDWAKMVKWIHNNPETSLQTLVDRYTNFAYPNGSDDMYAEEAMGPQFKVSQGVYFDYMPSGGTYLCTIQTYKEGI